MDSRSSSDIRTSLDPQKPEDRRLIERLLQHPAYAGLAEGAASLLEESIAAKSSPRELLNLQAKLGGNILGLQEQRTELILAMKEGRLREREPLGIMTKALQVSRGIADGIAWRALSYDRLVIRQLSQHNPTGYLDADGFKVELSAAHERVERTGEVVVINDLTNCLLFADLTAVGPEGVTLQEVKAGRGSADSGHSARQARLAERRVNLIRGGQSESPSGGLVTLLRPDVSARNHLGRVAELIDESKHTGVSAARLTPALAVQVLRPHMLVSPVASGDPFGDESPTIRDTTLTLFDLWSPNVPPLSVYPYPIPDRTGVMLGLVVITCFCNLAEVTAALERRDLGAYLPTLEDLERLASMKPWEQIRNQHDAAMRVTDSAGRELRIPFSGLKPLTAEFLDEESFVDLVVATMNSSRSSNEVMPTFDNDSRLWD